MRRLSVPGLLVVQLAAGCGGTGGITAELRLVEALPGQHRSRLGPASLPLEVGRLEIAAFEVSGSTLARTVLSMTPGDGEEPLHPEGGTWRLTGVAAGSDRILSGRAFLHPLAGAGSGGVLAFSGARTGIEVRAGATTDVGILELNMVPGVRIPRLDHEAPGAPGPVTLTPEPRGEELLVHVTRPSDLDVAGYLVAWTSSLAASLSIPRGQAELLPGTILAPGVTVAAWIPTADPSATRIPDLGNDHTYKVLAFAFDADLEGRALNFSAPAVALGRPADSEPPGPIEGLTVTAKSSTLAEVRFVGPGEDGPLGRPAAYELRTAGQADDLDPAHFSGRPALRPPAVVEPGATSREHWTFAELGASPTGPFFLGLRAIDASGNIGPITIARHAGSSTTTPPLVDRMSPQIGIAGALVEIQGQLFGAVTGTVTLAVTTPTVALTSSLRVRSWSDQKISVELPSNARSGEIQVIRAGDGNTSSPQFLPILQPIVGQLSPAALPFAAVGAPLSTTVTAVFRQRPVSRAYEEGIERLFGPIGERITLVPFNTDAAPRAIGATYSLGHDRFLFATFAEAASAISFSMVSSSSVGPSARRLPRGVAAAGVDSLAVEILTSTPSADRLSVLLVLAAGGGVYTATTSDLLSEAFSPFTTVTATTEVADHVAVLRRPTGPSALEANVWIAHRSGGPASGRLALATARGDGTAPFVRAAGLGPPVGERVRLLDVPRVGPLAVYEERQADASFEVRILPLARLGAGVGVSPFAGPATNRRLEDAGLVERDGEIWLAVAVTEGPQLLYVEVDPAQITGDGRWSAPLAALDHFVGGAVGAELSCRRGVARECALVWNGPSGPAKIFMRR